MASIEYQNFDCEINPKQYLRGIIQQGKGADVVALHGFLDNSMIFTPLFPFLKNQQIYATDLAGHGKSDIKSMDFLCYTILDYAVDVIKMIRKKSPEARVNLIGHSLGAGISVLIASMAPDLINKMVLIDNLAPITAEANELVERLRRFNLTIDKTVVGRVLSFV